MPNTSLYQPERTSYVGFVLPLLSKAQKTMFKRSSRMFIMHKRRCLYPLPRNTAPSEEQNVVSPTKIQQSHGSDAVSVYFLDEDIFKRGQMIIPAADLLIPADVSSLVGDSASVQATAAEYFETVHLWWSILSKHSFYSHLLNPLVPRRGDVVLLLLCMKLIVWRPSADNPDPRTALYFTAKRFHTELESQGAFSIRALQAVILIALYEFGHGIYPSVLSSIATCARYGRALDIDLSPKRRPSHLLSYFELEERRRAWWSILILDRFANITCPGPRFETRDPETDDLLPVDGLVWDSGLVSPADEMTIANPVTEKLGRFAKFAQATHLLCRVLQIMSDASTDDDFREEQKLQLEKAILATIRMVSGPVTGPKGAHAMICFSSLFLLYGDILNTQPSTPLELSRYEHARDVLEQGANTCAETSFHFQQGSGLPAEKVAALVVHWQYRAAAFYLHMRTVRANDEDLFHLTTLKTGLCELEKRWKVAGTYLRMLEARELMQI
ncbi:hypothetical protein H2200_002069 [Cladophialophora chaetospira]|uniref:Xylanolytic transcriptional activator regulatory domain-containing protein n=1 Tax=Cladophialophora chaetospira TaxID=386627 RepID=A0AA38XID9_9EURO|nr:hypothetical protein H2200_002069 [Cladophialophora chaetospira]